MAEKKAKEIHIPLDVERYIKHSNTIKNLNKKIEKAEFLIKSINEFSENSVINIIDGKKTIEYKNKTAINNIRTQMNNQLNKILDYLDGKIIE